MAIGAIPGEKKGGSKMHVVMVSCGASATAAASASASAASSGSPFMSAVRSYLQYGFVCCDPVVAFAFPFFFFRSCLCVRIIR